MLTHDQIKKIILNNFGKQVRKGKIYVGSDKLLDRRKIFAKDTSGLSVEQMQQLKMKQEEYISKINAALNDLAPKIENEYVAHIRSGTASPELHGVLVTYVQWYNEFKIQNTILDEIKIQLYGEPKRDPKKKYLPTKKDKVRLPKLKLYSGNEILQRAGGWIIRFNGKDQIVVPDRLGMEYIAYVIECSPTRVHCELLLNLSSEGGEHFGTIKGDNETTRAILVDVENSPGMKVQDSQTQTNIYDNIGIQKYKKRIETLKIKLETDTLTAKMRTKYEDDLDKLKNEVLTAGPRATVKSTEDEKVKKKVAKAISEAITFLEEFDKDLAEHLHKSISSGMYVEYSPKEDISWTVERFRSKKRKK